MQAYHELRWCMRFSNNCCWMGSQRLCRCMQQLRCCTQPASQSVRADAQLLGSGFAAVRCVCCALRFLPCVARTAAEQRCSASLLAP